MPACYSYRLLFAVPVPACVTVGARGSACRSCGGEGSELLGRKAPVSPREELRGFSLFFHHKDKRCFSEQLAGQQDKCSSCHLDTAYAQQGFRDSWRPSKLVGVSAQQGSQGGNSG